MEVKKQTDQDIPIHIVSKVNSQQNQEEALLSRRHVSSNKSKGRRNYASTHLDLGLTISSANISNANQVKSNTSTDFLTSLQKRYEKEKLQQRHQLQAHQQENDTTKDDQQSLRAAAEAEAYALSRMSHSMNTLHDRRHTGGNSDDEYGDHDEKENMDVSGRSIFGFSAARKKSTHNMMRMVAQHDTSIEKDDNQPVDIQVKKRGRPSKESNQVKPEIKKRGRPTKQTIDVDAEEDKGKRQRIERKQELNKALQQRNNNGEDDDNDHGDNSDQTSEDDDDAHTQHEQREQKSLLEEASGYERYFQDLHGSSKTSNNTMSQLPALEPQEFQSILEAAPTKHGQECIKLTAHHEQHFPQWLFELRSGFNLVFYGYGSKRQLLNKFAMQVMTDGPLIVVNGFFPSITIKDIMAKILIGALEATAMPGTLQEQLAMVRGYFTDKNRGYRRLYLVVHNMDGLNLRHENSQAALASLAETPNVHLVGSIDQINAGLLWDNVKSARFNWIYHDATTFDDYLVETSFENTLLMGANENGGARGVQHVLASLTSNGRGIFRVLAEHQMFEMEINNVDRGSEQVALPYHQYFEKCREQFLVSTETGMRSQLTEFKDHKVMVTKRLLDGTELLYMPLDRSTLIAIVESMD